MKNVGDHTIEIILSDDKGGYDAQLFTLTVNNINDAPVFDFAPPSPINEDATFSFQPLLRQILIWMLLPRR